MSVKGRNQPFAFGGYYPEGPVPVYKVGPRRWRFMEEWTHAGVTIPEGYEVDGASVPRPMWFILSPASEGFRAACIHDFRHVPGMTKKQRKFADDEFYRNLRLCKLSFTRAFLAWLGVRFWAHVTFWTFERE